MKTKTTKHPKLSDIKGMTPLRIESIADANAIGDIYTCGDRLEPGGFFLALLGNYKLTIIIIDNLFVS